MELTLTIWDDLEIHNKEHLLIGWFQVHGNKAARKNTYCEEKGNFPRKNLPQTSSFYLVVAIAGFHMTS